ncbi:MAG: hypothetical protein HUJ92_01730, partial [Bacteroidales bacterium]|nr:hypothetical protein [Bacteroidales bacterium]
MQVKENIVDELNRSVTIIVEKADYAESKKKKLNDARRKAEIRGFRKGMAPMSLIEKLYGGSALGEAVQEVVTDSLNKYVDDNKLNLIGEALPNEEADKNDWENSEEFSFTFDMGICPEINATVSAEDHIQYHEVTVSAKAVEEYKENLLKQFGTMESGEAAKEDDFIVVDFAQGETVVTNAYVALRSIEDADIKAKFIGIKVGDVLDVNVNDTFKNETDRAAMLKVKKEELADMDPIWKMTVKEVKTFVAAKAEQATFDKMYGEGVVTSEEEFDKKVKEQLKSEYAGESDYRFSKDARDYFVKKANISLPEGFIKRWL